MNTPSNSIDGQRGEGKAELRWVKANEFLPAYHEKEQWTKTFVTRWKYLKEGSFNCSLLKSHEIQHYVGSGNNIDVEWLYEDRSQNQKIFMWKEFNAKSDLPKFNHFDEYLFEVTSPGEARSTYCKSTANYGCEMVSMGFKVRILYDESVADESGSASAPQLLSQLNAAKEENERLKKHSAIANEKQMQMQERIDFQKECLEAAARERHSVVDSLKAEADALRREVEELKVKWEDSQLTQNLEQEIVNISDEDALIVYDIIGGPSISNEAKIANVKDLLTTNKFYVLQTNIPGGTWKKVFDLLETNGYKIP